MLHAFVNFFYNFIYSFGALLLFIFVDLCHFNGNLFCYKNLTFTFSFSYMHKSSYSVIPYTSPSVGLNNAESSNGRFDE